MTEPGQDSVEPGSPALSRVVGWLVVVLVLVVAAMQQMSISAPPPEPAEAEALAPPETQFQATCRTAVMLHQIGRENPEYESVLNAAGGRPSAADIARVAETPEDKLRAAIVIAELHGAGPGLEQLGALRDLPKKPPVLDEDAAVVGRLFEGGEAAEEEAARLRDHHGWFGRLALVIGKPDRDPERQAVVGGGAQLVAVLVGGVLIGGVAMLVGFVVLIIGVVKWFSGTLPLRFAPLGRGGSALIETVAVFIVAFVAMKAVAGFVGKARPELETGFALVAQWLLLLVALWPVLRGMRRPAAMHALGLHRGRGVLREVGAGIVGYLACLPLLLVGLISMVIMMLIEAAIREVTGQKPAGQVRNPVFELVAGEDSAPWKVVVVFLLATVWAPVMEEIVFRGALFGHLRKRWGVLVSALIVAPAFGLMHGYPLVLLGGVMSLGFGFSLLREWRGSLIAPMVAHCINNFAILVFVITMMQALA